MEIGKGPVAPTQSLSAHLPAFLAYSAAILLAVASATTNVVSAIAKHDTMSGAFVAGAVALSVAILVLIAAPAAMSAARSGQWVASMLAALVFVLAASYSVTSALGVLGAPRLTATLAVDHVEKDRKRIADERARHASELSMLAPSRSMHELSPEIARILALPGIGGCALINGPVTRQWCPTLTSLQAEHARAERRAAQEGTLARLDTEASRLGGPKLANADSATLIATFAAFGLALDSGLVNAGLMLLAVTILECGSGLALVMAQSMRAALPVAPILKDITPEASALAAQSVAVVPAPSVPAIAETPSTASLVTSGSVAEQAASKIVQLVRDSGGSLTVASRRQLASMTGMSSPTIGRALAALAGIVAVSATTEGVALKLVG